MLEEFEFIEYEMPKQEGGFEGTATVEENFVDFTARCNKSYPGLREYRKRFEQWEKAKGEAQKKNNSDSMAQFGTNCLSDFNQEELDALVGLSDDIEEDEINSDGLTNLCATDDSVVCNDRFIDWVALEKVHPVKD